MGRPVIVFAIQNSAREKSNRWLNRLTISNFAGSFFTICLLWSFVVTRSFPADRVTTNKPTINGTWKFNLRKSNMANMPVPQQETLVVSMHENRLKWREIGIDGKGHHFDQIWDGLIDGRPRLLKGTRAQVTVSFQQKHGAIVFKWKGKGKRLSIAKLSPNGQTLTVENASDVYNMVSNWTTSWDRAPRD
jgi:hypothetical protein